MSLLGVWRVHLSPPPPPRSIAMTSASTSPAATSSGSGGTASRQPSTRTAGPCGGSLSSSTRLRGGTRPDPPPLVLCDQTRPLSSAVSTEDPFSSASLLSPRPPFSPCSGTAERLYSRHVAPVFELAGIRCESRGTSYFTHDLLTLGLGGMDAAPVASAPPLAPPSCRTLS